MSLVVDRLAVRGPHGPLLSPTSFVAERGVVTIVAGDPGPSGIALALALGGQMRGVSGSVALDGGTSPSALRKAVALVDVPLVTEPEPSVSARVVVGEELALAGRPASLRDIRRYISSHSEGEEGLAGRRWEQLPPGLRTRWLIDFAVGRPGVEALVVTHPDRWGGDPTEWYQEAGAVAADGRIVVVTCTHSSARLLGVATDNEIGVAA